MQSKAEVAQILPRQDLHKIHKNYPDIPSFSNIVDTTINLHYGDAKYFASLVHCVTQ